jgi:phospholipid/cholesterol/gamma-HCH transport system ATP-binding protein
VSLIGGSGTGKSVLLRAIIGLESPDRGEILFKGKNLVGLSEDEWIEVRKSIAYAFQGGALFDSLTVEENLLYPLDAHTKLSRSEKQKKVDATLDLLGLKGANHLLPSDLSGGMQKRAGLARALILDPEVILYDEPTAGLDPFNTKNVQDIINDLKARGKAGVLVTHDMPTAMATCERLSLLMNGRIEISGHMNALKDHPLVKSFITGEMAYGKTQ